MVCYVLASRVQIYARIMCYHDEQVNIACGIQRYVYVCACMCIILHILCLSNLNLQIPAGRKTNWPPYKKTGHNSLSRGICRYIQVFTIKITNICMYMHVLHVYTSIHWYMNVLSTICTYSKVYEAIMKVNTCMCMYCSKNCYVHMCMHVNVLHTC